MRHPALLTGPPLIRACFSLVGKCRHNELFLRISAI
jgi:hypothetical protein